MTEGTVLDLALLHLTLIHLMLASLASVVVAGNDRLATHYACREIAPTRTTSRVILADNLFAVPAWALDPFSGGLFGWVFSENTHSDVHILLPVI